MEVLILMFSLQTMGVVRFILVTHGHVWKSSELGMIAGGSQQVST